MNMTIHKKDKVTLQIVNWLGVSLLVSLGMGILLSLIAPEQLSYFSNVIITIAIVIGTVVSGTKLFGKLINV